MCATCEHFKSLAQTTQVKGPPVKTVVTLFQMNDIISIHIDASQHTFQEKTTYKVKIF